jgi:hypothetical protein
VPRRRRAVATSVCAAIECTVKIVVPVGFTGSDYPKGAESRDESAMVHPAGKTPAGRPPA